MFSLTLSTAILTASADQMKRKVFSRKLVSTCLNKMSNKGIVGFRQCRIPYTSYHLDLAKHKDCKWGEQLTWLVQRSADQPIQGSIINRLQLVCSIHTQSNVQKQQFIVSVALYLINRYKSGINLTRWRKSGFRRMSYYFLLIAFLFTYLVTACYYKSPDI